MCRILAVRSQEGIDIVTHLEKLSNISKNSQVFQGHGWGISYYEKDKWKLYRNINPIWESDFSNLDKTKIFLAHARSAFQDEGIEIENNMPFLSNSLSFIFNGELRGVKIKESGRIGAEKIFNYIQRFTHDNLVEGIDNAIAVINKRTEYIRALNFIISDGAKFYTKSQYNEEPDYFRLHKSISDDLVIISSEVYSGYSWKKIHPGRVEVL
ncbi:MAG: Gamma-glutamyl-hercynylcysteine sulfoxide hydrolase [Candidatus Heimdallarchaeota archaeon LC_2]|nr:MAG: Gamma-glutamyl-hercynylcysteine sulfoxide hydrolase [Candidatus Heimdallarchaeota archaeon LC_2]